MDWDSTQFYGFVVKISKGDIGPSMAQYNRKRPPLWPTAKTILDKCGLELDRFGWIELLGWCRLGTPERLPGPHDWTTYGAYDFDKIAEYGIKGMGMGMGLWVEYDERGMDD